MDNENVCIKCENVYCQCDGKVKRVKMNEGELKCLCGNEPSLSGFYPCDENGVYCEPDKKWGGLYKCDDCKGIINPETLEIR